MLVELAQSYVAALNWTAMLYFGVLNGAYLLLLALSALELGEYLRKLRYGSYDLLFRDPSTPAVALLMPCYNEGVNVVVSVRGALNLNYPTFDVIVINDGSTDDTLEALKKAYRLVLTERAADGNLPSKPVRGAYRSLVAPNLIVIDKENGGKADALNAGINNCRTPYFCAVDGDAVLEEDALLRVMRPVIEDPERMVAVGGIVRVANGCKIANARVVTAALPRPALPMFQVVEYLRAFLGGRKGFSRLNGLLIISGAFGLFSKKWAIAAGGYRTDTVGEDMELICSMHRVLRQLGVNYKIGFIADPVCWTEVPSDTAVLARQRRRWQRGLLEVLSIHRQMFLRPRYGVLAFFSFPFFLLFEGWGPALELLGYLSFLLCLLLGWVDVPFAVAFLTLSVLMGTLISLCAILMEELSFKRYPGWKDFARLLAYGLLENVSYRPLTSWYRFLGMIDFLRNKKGWGVMTRRGLTSAALLIFFPPAVLGQDYYELGSAARREGRIQDSKTAFLKLLEKNSNSPDGLEGLAVAQLRLGENEEAARTLERWSELEPRNGYVTDLLRRAHERREAGLRSLPGAHARAAAYKAIGPEGLGTTSAQRVAYSGLSAGGLARRRWGRLAGTAGAEVRREAQRNDTQGFTFYDVTEQIYTGGLELRPSTRTWLSASYGQSFYSGGGEQFSRLELGAAAGPVKLTASRLPKLLRGAGGSRYFSIIRRSVLSLEAETSLKGWDLSGRGGVEDYSSGPTIRAASVSARRELGRNSLRLWAIHDNQEFYGAGPDGRIRFMPYERGGAHVSRRVDRTYEASAGYWRQRHEDRNDLDEVSAEAAVWAPKLDELWASYRFALLDYSRVDPGYRSLDQRSHWAGVNARRRLGSLWARAGWEHGFLFDPERRRYEANAWLGELQWRSLGRFAATLKGRAQRSTVKDDFFSIELTASLRL